MTILPPGRYAIITGITGSFWEDYIEFYKSSQNVGQYLTIVFNHGLSFKQELKLQQQQVQSVPVTNERAQEYSKMDDDRWIQWYKPEFILEAIIKYDIDYAIWIDADTVLLKPLDPLFHYIQHNFLVLSDYFAPKSTLNNSELYQSIGIYQQDKNISLNSGVVGFANPRDLPLLKKWISNTYHVAKHQHLKKHISLYDQGVLIWTLHEMNRIQEVFGDINWNYPAKRNAYELNGKYKWPLPQGVARMGGDLLSEIKLDNPNAIIAHYAGLPKLSQLCQVNHESSKTYIQNKFKGQPAIKLFIVGLERAGTHTIAESLRQSMYCESWIRHEHHPVLAFEAKQKFLGKEHYSPLLKYRIEQIYNREDVHFVCESNHRLSWFCEEIFYHTQGTARFILMLRDPVTLIRSRLHNFSIWISELERYPGCYQFDYLDLPRTFGPGSPDQNTYRISPDNIKSMGIIDLHIWEIEQTLLDALRQLEAMPDEAWTHIWLEELPGGIDKLLNHIDPRLLNRRKLQKLARNKYGQHLQKIRPETKQWIGEIVEEHSDKIYDRLGKILYDHNLLTSEMII